MSAEISRRAALEAAAALAVPMVAGAALPAHAAEAPPDGPAPAPAADVDAADVAARVGASEELAHYYRFQEIVEGRQLVQRSGRWRFEGAPIVLDPEGVYRMVDDPDTTRLPEGSPERHASEACDRVYTDVLRALQRVFDGHPEELQHASSLMRSLERHATELARMPHPAAGRVVLGPAFQVHLPATAAEAPAAAPLLPRTGWENR